jgi:hypothetical protein
MSEETAVMSATDIVLADLTSTELTAALVDAVVSHKASIDALTKRIELLEALLMQSAVPKNMVQH